jgi:hypothetical protein
MSSTRKTSEHPGPTSNLPGTAAEAATTEAAEAATTEAAEAATTEAAEAAEAAEAVEAVEAVEAAGGGGSALADGSEVATARFDLATASCFPTPRTWMRGLACVTAEWVVNLVEKRWRAS